MAFLNHLRRGLGRPLPPLLALLGALALSGPAPMPAAVPVAHLADVPPTPCFRIFSLPYANVVEGSSNTRPAAWVSPTCGTPETVSLSLQGVPAGVTATLSPDPAVVTKTATPVTLSLTAARGTPFATYPAQLVASDQAGSVVTRPIRLIVGSPISLVVTYDSANEFFWNDEGAYLRDPAPRGLQVGDRIYGDRKVTFSQLPSSLLGAAWEQTAFASRRWPGDDVGDPLATLNVGRQADVYIGVDRKGQLPPFIDASWTDSGLTAKASDGVVYRLFRKTLSPTTTLQVVMTRAAQKGAMFTVIVV